MARLKSGTSLRGPRLLVVDDDDDFRDLMVLVLEDEGYEVATAKNGREALDALDGGPRPDVLLLDLMMPVLSGWEVLDVLRARSDTVPVLVLSASHDVPVERLGAAGFLRKPPSIDGLLACVAACLAKGFSAAGH